jgi:hypothetical protein
MRFRTEAAIQRIAAVRKIVPQISPITGEVSARVWKNSLQYLKEW